MRGVKRAEVTCPECRGEGMAMYGHYSWAGGYGTEEYQECEEVCDLCGGEGSVFREEGKNEE